MLVAVQAAARQAAVRQGVRAFSSTPAQAASLRDLEHRVKSVKNIKKITSSMKMIATTKLNKAQAAMKTAKLYGAANVEIFSQAEVEASAESGKKVLWIVVSSDKGLCGGIHSSVSKQAKRSLSEASGGSLEGVSSDIPVVVLGDKPKQQLGRALPNNLVLSFNQVGKQVPTFAEACAIADQIDELKVNYDSVKIIYNKFVSSISYEAAIMEVHNADALRTAEKFKAYEMEDADDALVNDLASFALTNAIYATLVEGHATEISARRNAMDNASKNAGEMIDKLQMQFNRQRQAVITNELVDIITGASAL